MYIGKVKVTNEWQQLDALIQAQVEGQGAFTFDASTTYQLQAEGKYGVRLCEAAETPDEQTGQNDGLCIEGTKTAHYKPAGHNLYIRQVADTAVPPYLWLKISTLED